MTEKEKGFSLDWAALKLAVILFAFAAAVAVLLGLVNAVTHERIGAHNAEKSAAAKAAVLPADSYEELPLTGNLEKIETVRQIFRAGDEGWVVMVAPGGFGGEIQMAVGIDGGGAVTGLSIIQMSETSGLGANARRESFRSQFIGRSGAVALTKQGGEIDALTGATVTSTAVVKGVNAALAAACELMREEEGA